MAGVEVGLREMLCRHESCVMSDGCVASAFSMHHRQKTRHTYHVAPACRWLGQAEAMIKVLKR